METVTVYKLLDYKDAAKLLGMSESTLRKTVSRREIPHVKIGRLVRFRYPKDIEKFLERNAIPEI